jgi:hypothetical protein
MILLPLLASCTLVDLEVEVPEVCVSAAPIEFLGGDLEGEWSQESSSEFTAQARDVLDTLTKIGTPDTLRLRSLDVRVTGDVEVVGSLELLFHAPNSGLRSLVAFQCDDCAIAAGQLFTEVEAFELLPYIYAPALELGATVRGELPQQAWSIEIDACFASSASRTVDF